METTLLCTTSARRHLFLEVIVTIFNGSLRTENFGCNYDTEKLTKVKEKPKQILDIIHELQ